MDLQQAIHHALEGSSLLFVGSGFSTEARNVQGKPLPTATTLASELAAWCGVDVSVENPRLDQVADLALAERGASQLVKFLHDQFQVKAVAPEHVSYARIPWRRIYTTNYDSVVELAWRDAGNPIVSLDPRSRPSRLREPVQHCIHLNGHIESLTPDLLETAFKLTGSSYVSGALADSEWASALRHDLFLAKSVFYVGYSLYDLDVKRLLAATDGLRAKTFFVLSTNDRLAKHSISTFGSIVEENAQSFAKVLDKERTSFVPSSNATFEPVAVAELHPPEAPIAEQGNDIFELLLHGRLSQPRLWEAIAGTPGIRHICLRHVVGTVMDRIEMSTAPVVVLSDLGNGKSTLLNLVSALAQSRGYRVFIVEGGSEEALRDLEGICKLTTRTLVVIDDYTEKAPVLETLARFRDVGTRVLLAARTSRHETRVDWLFKKLSIDDVREVNIDRLETRDLQWFDACLEQHGLWGEHAADDPLVRVKHLSHACQSSMSGILLDIMKAPQIASRLKTIVDALSSDESSYLRAVASVLVLSLLGLTNDDRVVNDMVDSEILNSARFRKSPAVRELFDFSRGMSARNALVAKHLLGTIPTTAVLESVVDMVERADALRHEHVYYRIFIRLMKATEIQQAFPESGRTRTMISYYRALTRIRACTRSEQFWLQYAIAMILLRHFKEARVQLETAYALGRKRVNFDTYMLDNTAARLELVQVTEEFQHDTNAAMAAFRKARTSIQKQVHDEEQRTYAFRVASLYKGFFEAYSGVLSSEYRQEVMTAVEYIYKKADQASERSRQPDVTRCRQAMLDIASRAKVRIAR